jgi:hypothetical protein
MRLMEMANKRKSSADDCLCWLHLLYLPRHHGLGIPKISFFEFSSLSLLVRNSRGMPLMSNDWPSLTIAATPFAVSKMKVIP